MKTSSFENFPWWMVVTSNAVGLAIYAIGFFLMLCLGIVWGVLYVAYCIWMEWRLLSGSCRNCYYYGKRCGFGKGSVCSWFFTRGAEIPLSAKQLSRRDLVPDLMVPLLPLSAGIIVLIRSFSWTTLLLVVALVFLGSAGTGFVRAQIVCKYCKQRELGCPAEQLFSRTKPAA